MRKHKPLYWILLCICLAGIAASAYPIARQMREYRAGRAAYIALAEAAAPTEAGAASVQPKSPAVDFDTLRAVNRNAAGWLYGGDTGISYPVVRAEDNVYYLNHLFDGTENSAGCLFIDSRCVMGWEGRHTIIYGHHMKDGSMFAALTEYAAQAYYDAHPRFLLLTPEGRYELAFFSGHTVQADSDAWRVDFASDADYAAWLEEVKARSLFISAVVPDAHDCVVTLSTCSYDQKDARFVLHGILCG